MYAERFFHVNALFNYPNNIALANHQHFLAINLHLVWRVLAEYHLVPDLDGHRRYFAALEPFARAHCKHFALLRLLFVCRVRQHDSARGYLLLPKRLDDHPIVEWTYVHTIFLLNSY